LVGNESKVVHPKKRVMDKSFNSMDESFMGVIIIYNLLIMSYSRRADGGKPYSLENTLEK